MYAMLNIRLQNNGNEILSLIDSVTVLINAVGKVRVYKSDQSGVTNGNHEGPNRTAFN